MLTKYIELNQHVLHDLVWFIFCILFVLCSLLKLHHQWRIESNIKGAKKKLLIHKFNDILSYYLLW